jgi:hypothetical protein
MNLVYYATLLILAARPVFPQDQPPAAVCRPEAKYDRDADTTTVQCDLIEKVAPTGRLIVRASSSFQGKEPNGTMIFQLGLASYKGGANRRTEHIFKDATTLSLSLDSARLEIPVKDYRVEFFELNRMLAEQARAEIGREDLQKLLHAKSLSGKWGVIEFTLSEAALASLKDFISRQVSGANDR